MGIPGNELVQIRHADATGDPTVVTASCPDKTGHGCRVVLLFSLNILKGEEMADGLKKQSSCCIHAFVCCQIVLKCCCIGVLVCCQIEQCTIGCYEGDVIEIETNGQYWEKITRGTLADLQAYFNTAYLEVWVSRELKWLSELNRYYDPRMERP